MTAWAVRARAGSSIVARRPLLVTRLRLLVLGMLRRLFLFQDGLANRLDDGTDDDDERGEPQQVEQHREDNLVCDGRKSAEPEHLSTRGILMLTSLRRRRRLRVDGADERAGRWDDAAASQGVYRRANRLHLQQRSRRIRSQA